MTRIAIFTGSLKSFGFHLGFAVLLLGAFCFSGRGLAQATEAIEDDEDVTVFRVVLLPLPKEDDSEENGPMGQLYQALELELVLNEQLLMVPPEKMQASISDEANEALPPSLQAAMKEYEIDAVIRTRKGPDAPILQIHRQTDGGVVLAKRLDVPLSKTQVETLYQEIQLTIQELNDLPALSLLALSVLEAPSAKPEGEVQRTQPSPDPKSTGDAGAASERAKEGGKPKDPATASSEKVSFPTTEESEDEPPEPAAPLDRLGRLVLSHSPSLLIYQACQPPSGAFPFACDNREDLLSSSALVLPWGGLLSSAASLEMYPWVPYLGLTFEGSLFRSQLVSPSNFYNVSTIDILGGHLQTAAMGRAVFSFGFLTLGVGVRLGYQLLFAIVDEHYIELEEEDEIYAVTLLPSYLVHSGLVGISSTIQLWKWVRLQLDTDLIPAALSKETPTTLGDNPLSVGLHAKIQLDLDLFWGLLLSVHAEGTGINTNTTGEGTRITRQLVPFRSGRSVLLQGKIGGGLGFHF